MLDPGDVEFVGFRRSTIEEIESVNPNIRRQLAEWQQARRQNSEDPNEYDACRRHLRALGVADPGQIEFLGFFSSARTYVGCRQRAYHVRPNRQHAPRGWAERHMTMPYDPHDPDRDPDRHLAVQRRQLGLGSP